MNMLQLETGAEMALGVLDPGFKQGLSEQEALDMATKAVHSANNA